MVMTNKDIADLNKQLDKIKEDRGPNDLERRIKNLEDINKSFQSIDFTTNKPKIIIANTIKGKGVPDMEDNYGAWHSKVPNDEELEYIYKQIDSYEQ